MTNLTFIRNSEGKNEATFTAGSVNVLQVKYAEPASDANNSLAVQVRLDASLPYQTVKLYVPCPTRCVSLPVHAGEVRLVTDLDIIAAGVAISSGTGNLSPDYVAALIEQVEQNRLAIESQAKINDDQQVQIDENTRVNEQQQTDLEQEYTNDDVKKLWDQVMTP